MLGTTSLQILSNIDKIRKSIIIRSIVNLNWYFKVLEAAVQVRRWLILKQPIIQQLNVGHLVGSPSDWSSAGSGWPSCGFDLSLFVGMEPLVGHPSSDPSPSSSSMITPNRVFRRCDGEIGIGDGVGVLFCSSSDWSSSGGGNCPSGGMNFPLRIGVEAPVARASLDSSSSSSSMLAPNWVFLMSYCSSWWWYQRQRCYRLSNNN